MSPDVLDSVIEDVYRLFPNELHHLLGEKVQGTSTYEES